MAQDLANTLNNLQTFLTTMATSTTGGTGGSGGTTTITLGATPNRRETRLVDFLIFKGGNQDPLEWIEAFTNACNANNVADDDRKLELVPAYLKGDALTW